jgi:predicted O-methyltransferase YrrM
LDARLEALADAAKGFMPPGEGLALHDAALEAAAAGPLLEIGSYCGKSALYLGAAARERGTVLYSIDHHRGSEEIQPGWEHHDPELVDPATGRMDSFPFFRATIAAAGLDGTVIALVGDSPTIARLWRLPLGLVFVDGAHSEDLVRADYDGWAPHVARGGLLAFHDVFADERDGGRGPFNVYERARESGDFVDVSRTGSLRVLRRVGHSDA